jgi:hypothetical protein
MSPYRPISKEERERRIDAMVADGFFNDCNHHTIEMEEGQVCILCGALVVDYRLLYGEYYEEEEGEKPEVKKKQKKQRKNEKDTGGS